MLLFFIRHGDPIYNPDSLTPLGERQAESVAKRLALYGVDKVYASTSERARLTAVPTCELLGKQMIMADWCNENHAWKQLTVINEQGKRQWGFQNPELAAFFNSPELRKMGPEWYNHPHFDGTQFKQGILRIGTQADAFLSELGYRHDVENCVYIPEAPNDDRIALFAHQGFGLAFLSWILDIPYPTFCTHFDTAHTGMTVIEFPNTPTPVIPKLLTLSNDSHLYRDGIPTRYQNRIAF